MLYLKVENLPTVIQWSGQVPSGMMVILEQGTMMNGHIYFTVNQGALKAYLDGKLVFKGDDFRCICHGGFCISIGVNY